MKILILAEAYPSAGRPYAMGFVHARAKHQLAAGHEVTVLSFSAAVAYSHEGVRVCSESDLPDVAPFDIVHAHAPNLRNHLRWLRRHGDMPLLMFVHGHELLQTRRYYPRPYPFQRNLRERLTFASQALYDPIKLRALRHFCEARSRCRQRFGFVFVSDWMRREALACNPWLPAGLEEVPSESFPTACTRHSCSGAIAERTSCWPTWFASARSTTRSTPSTNWSAGPHAHLD